jgi:hypothetical protein
VCLPTPSIPQENQTVPHASHRIAATPQILAALFISAGLMAPSAGYGADPAATPKASSQQRADRAKGLALATETVHRISEAQLLVADRVLTGEATCDFDQTVDLQPIAGKPGQFRLRYKKTSYTMIPEETTTGAVRLEDKMSGIVWLQIPSKSMLMNARAGQRMVDGCMHPEQRAAVAASKAAGASVAPEGEKKP